jgi:hypothetical protein
VFLPLVAILNRVCRTLALASAIPRSSSLR